MEPTIREPFVRTELTTLHRPLDGRLAAGVAAGIAGHFDVEVVLVRLAFVVLAVMGGLGIPLYAAAWLFLPEEGADRSVAEELVGRTPRPARHVAMGAAAPGSTAGSGEGSRHASQR